jgi:hypothetical protein
LRSIKVSVFIFFTATSNSLYSTLNKIYIKSKPAPHHFKAAPGKEKWCGPISLMLILCTKLVTCLHFDGASDNENDAAPCGSGSATLALYTILLYPISLKVGGALQYIPSSWVPTYSGQSPPPHPCRCR